MNGYGARAYQRVGVDTGVSSADPHQLILMLYDGALEAVRLGQAAMDAGDIPSKCSAIGKAVRIVDEGLKASLDRNTGEPLSFRLLDLYGYITMRLLQANLRNDRAALAEVTGLLGELRGAWAQIKPAHAGAGAAPMSVAANARVAALV